MNTKSNFSCLDRFLRYVVIDTQSDPNSKTIPSTEKQKDLGNLLVKELLDLGLEDAHLDEWGYVYATLPSNTNKDVPTICFCSHMDTSPDCSGTGVKPIVHRNYQGQDIVLPDDTSVVISPRDHPDLLDQIGNDIVTASGTTLLGADNKAGIAAIMSAVEYLVAHPEIKRGSIKILFTPDEEIGRGVDKVDLKKLGAQYGYTVDGEKAGSMEDETFSADFAIMHIEGISVHPGIAKGKMQSALKIAADIIASLPRTRLSPETTSGREGFIHPLFLQGHVESATIQFLLRSFVDEELVEQGQLLQKLLDENLEKYPGSKGKLEIREQYRNMKKILDQHPQVVEYAMEAITRTGLKPIKSSIRGGTDGSRLSFMGLPCPNIFAGEHAFHSKEEWVSVQDMEKAAETIVNICKIWEERS